MYAEFGKNFKITAISCQCGEFYKEILLTFYFFHKGAECVDSTDSLKSAAKDKLTFYRRPIT